MPLLPEKHPLVKNVTEKLKQQINTKTETAFPNPLEKAFYKHLLKFCIENNTTPDNCFETVFTDSAITIGQAAKMIYIECQSLTFEQAEELANELPFSAEQIYKGFL